MAVFDVIPSRWFPVESKPRDVVACRIGRGSLLLAGEDGREPFPGPAGHTAPQVGLGDLTVSQPESVSDLVRLGDGLCEDNVCFVPNLLLAGLEGSTTATLLWWFVPWCPPKPSKESGLVPPTTHQCLCLSTAVPFWSVLARED